MNLYGEVILSKDEVSGGLLEDIKSVELNGIGWVGNTPCVASWFVPYDLPEVIKIAGSYDAKCTVGPMRGSQRGIAVKNNDGHTVHCGKYYLAQKLGERVGKIMKSRSVCVLLFSLNKRHFGIFGELPANVGNRWKNEFINGLKIELGGIDKIKEKADQIVVLDGVPKSTFVVAYASRTDVYQSALELAREFRESVYIQQDMA